MNAMLRDKEPTNHVIDANLDHETTFDIDNISDNAVVPKINVSFVEGCANDSNSHTVINSNIESNNSSTDSLFLKDEAVKADNTTNGSLQNQRRFSLGDKKRDTEIVLTPRRPSITNKMKYTLSSTSLAITTVLHYKVLMVIAVCFITGCYLMPIALYYISQAGADAGIDPQFSHERNTSKAKVCNKVDTII